MKRKRTSGRSRSPTTGSGQLSAAKPRRVRRWLIAVGVLAVIGALAVFWDSWIPMEAAPRRVGGPSAETAVPPGAPPVDAAAVLELSPQLPKTVEEVNEEALAVGRLVVDSLPDHPEAHAQMAFAHLQVGQDRDALESWRQAVKKDETFADGYLGMGAILKELGRNEGAIAAFRKAIEVSPELEHAYRELTEILLRADKAKQALPVARECVRRFPGVRENHFWLGQTYLQLERYEEALQAHKDAVRVDADFTLSYNSMSQIAVRLGRKEEAADYRKRFAELKAAELEADRNRARSYDDFATQRHALVKRHVLAGVLQLKAGDPRFAEAHWLRAGAIDPQDTATREALASLYEQQQRPAAAVQVLGELAGIEPENPEPLLRKGRLLSRMGSWPEAEEALTETLELRPQSAEAHYLLAQIHLRRGSGLSTARAHAERGARLAPSADGLVLLAAVRAECGDERGAKAALKQAMALAPQNAQVRQMYEELHATD